MSSRYSLTVTIVFTILAMLLTSCAPVAPAQPAAPAAPAAPAVAQPTAPAAAVATAAPRKPSELRKITLLLPYIPTIAFYPVFVADKMGYFAEEGLQADIQPTKGASFVVQQIAAGKAEVGLAGAAAILTGMSQNLELKDVMRWMWTVTFPLITSGQTGVKTVADLKGKVVGISDPSGGDVPAVEAYLRSAGLEPRVNVDFLAVGEEVPSIMQAFKDGKIAAYSSGWESNVSFRAAGFDLVDLTPNQFKTLPSEDIVVPTKLAQNDPKVVAGITRAIAKGMLFGLEHPEATLALMKEVAPEEHTDLAYVWLYMAGAQASVLPTQKDGKYYFGAHSMPDWKNFAETLKASVGQVNVEPYLTEDFVQETNNFDYAKVVKDGADYAAAHPYPKKP